MDDDELILRCIDLARSAAQHGNHPFGAIITRDDRIVAEAENRVMTDLDPTGHGEVAAIRAACAALGTLDLSGCTLYTSAEPCWICSTTIRVTGISRVVFAAGSTSTAGGFQQPFPILTADVVATWPPPPKVVPYLLRDRSEALWQEIGWPPPRPARKL